MTNKEYLLTLSNEEIAKIICNKISEFEEENFEPELEFSEIEHNTQIDFANWLEERLKIWKDIEE